MMKFLFSSALGLLTAGAGCFIAGFIQNFGNNNLANIIGFTSLALGAITTLVLFFYKEC